MHDEVVTRRQWVSEQEFLDLLGAANLIPGPTSTELAIYLGFRRVGWLGLVLAGVCFILPAMLIVLALAWAYVRFGSTPVASGLFYGIMPVVIAIVVQALWNLGRQAVKNWLTGVLGLLVIALYFLRVNILVLLLAAGVDRHAGGKPFPDQAPARGRVLAAAGQVPVYWPVPFPSASRSCSWIS